MLFYFGINITVKCDLLISSACRKFGLRHFMWKWVRVRGIARWCVWLIKRGIMVDKTQTYVAKVARGVPACITIQKAINITSC